MSTHATNIIRTTYACTFKLRNRYNICTCIAFRGVLISVLQESQGLHMLFLCCCYGWYLYHTCWLSGWWLPWLLSSALLGEVTICRTWTTRVNELYQKCAPLGIKKFLHTWKRFYTCLTSPNNHFLYTGYFSHILHLDIIKTPNWKWNEKNTYICTVW